MNFRKLRARLVIEFKNCCLKRCENYSLKSVVEIRVFSVYKTKKCVWYHILNNMFQCSKNIKMCLVCVFDLKKKKLTPLTEINIFLFKKYFFNAIGTVWVRLRRQ